MRFVRHGDVFEYLCLLYANTYEVFVVNFVLYLRMQAVVNKIIYIRAYAAYV